MDKVMKIEVDSATVEERGGVIRSGERKGEEWKMRAQVGYLYNGGKYPVKVSIPLRDDQPAYGVGMYTLAPESFEVGDFDRLQFARHLVLVPLVEAVEAAPRSRAAG